LGGVGQFSVTCAPAPAPAAENPVSDLASEAGVFQKPRVPSKHKDGGFLKHRYGTK
jgi:hypothetical protein